MKNKNPIRYFTKNTLFILILVMFVYDILLDFTKSFWIVIQYLVLHNFQLQFFKIICSLLHSLQYNKV